MKQRHKEAERKERVRTKKAYLQPGNSFSSWSLASLAERLCKEEGKEERRRGETEGRRRVKGNARQRERGTDLEIFTRLRLFEYSC
jgi:hypothetical protein